MTRVPFLAGVASLVLTPALAAQTTAPPAAPPPAATATAAGPSYADIADLAIASPMVIDATVRSTTQIKGAEAVGLAPGKVRLYVEADVTGLLRGTAAIPPRVSYLFDAAADARGRPPKLRKVRVLLFARAVPNAPDQVQLVKPDAQRDWTPALDAMARKIVAELAKGDAPPIITGIGNAFHVAGSLPGEGETQIFLTTADNRPVSLSVLRRPGEQPRWAVALTEIVDDSAGPPPRETLLWYRLACTLPPELPERSTASLGAPDAAVAREDYGFVLQQLGQCDRGGAAADTAQPSAPAPAS